MTDVRARELLGHVTGVTVAGAGTNKPGDSPTLVVAQVTPEHWVGAAAFVKDTLGCTFFSFLTAIDWKDQGLEVIAWVDNLESTFSVELRTKLGAGVAECPSITAVFRGANWMERECFDMFGVRFTGHPDLRRILLADDWEGHPLLKSYAVDTPHPPYR
jgi:NADH-quinone oxidoreductase subunit C